MNKKRQVCALMLSLILGLFFLGCYEEENADCESAGEMRCHPDNEKVQIKDPYCEWETFVNCTDKPIEGFCCFIDGMPTCNQTPCEKRD